MSSHPAVSYTIRLLSIRLPSVPASSPFVSSHPTIPFTFAQAVQDTSPSFNRSRFSYSFVYPLPLLHVLLSCLPIPRSPRTQIHHPTVTDPLTYVCIMDVQDASQDPECLPFLRAEEQAILNTQFVKGRRPDKKLSRAQAAAIMAKISLEESPTKKGVRCFYVYPGYPPCMVPLSDLTKVMIDDLTLETHHRGSYIVLRTITPGETRLDPVVAVEDEDQRGILLQLPNMAAELSVEPHLLDKGTVLLVKEPYLRSIADRAYSIRVDHRSNLVFLLEYDSEFPFTWLLEMDASESDWKVRGDDMLSKQVYHIAIEWYDAHEIIHYMGRY